MQESIINSIAIEDSLIVVELKDQPQVYLAIPSIQRYLLFDKKIKTASLDESNQRIVINDSKVFDLSELLSYSFPIADYPAFKRSTLRLLSSQKVYLLVSVASIFSGTIFQTPILILLGVSMLIASFFLLCSYCIMKNLPMYFKSTHLYPIASHAFQRKVHVFIGAMILVSYLSFVFVQVLGNMQGTS